MLQLIEQSVRCPEDSDKIVILALAHDKVEEEYPLGSFGLIPASQPASNQRLSFDDGVYAGLWHNDVTRRPTLGNVVDADVVSPVLISLLSALA